MIRVLLISDVRVCRECVAERLARSPHIDVVGSCATAAEGLAQMAWLEPDVAVLDVAAWDGEPAPRGLAALAEAVRVIVIGVTNHPDDILACCEAGAAGFVTRDQLCNKQIAQRLVIQVPTVKAHVHNLLEKLGLRSRGEVAAWFRRTRPLD